MAAASADTPRTDLRKKRLAYFDALPSPLEKSILSPLKSTFNSGKKKNVSQKNVSSTLGISGVQIPRNSPQHAKLPHSSHNNFTSGLNDPDIADRVKKGQAKTKNEKSGSLNSRAFNNSAPSTAEKNLPTSSGKKAISSSTKIKVKRDRLDINKGNTDEEDENDVEILFQSFKDQHLSQEYTSNISPSISEDEDTSIVLYKGKIISETESSDGDEFFGARDSTKNKLGPSDVESKFKSSDYRNIDNKEEFTSASHKMSESVPQLDDIFSRESFRRTMKDIGLIESKDSNVFYKSGEISDTDYDDLGLSTHRPNSDCVDTYISDGVSSVTMATNSNVAKQQHKGASIPNKHNTISFFDDIVDSPKRVTLESKKQDRPCQNRLDITDNFSDESPRSKTSIWHNVLDSVEDRASVSYSAWKITKRIQPSEITSDCQSPQAKRNLYLKALRQVLGDEQFKYLLENPKYLREMHLMMDNIDQSYLNDRETDQTARQKDRKLHERHLQSPFHSNEEPEVAGNVLNKNKGTSVSDYHPKKRSAFSTDEIYKQAFIDNETRAPRVSFDEKSRATVDPPKHVSKSFNNLDSSLDRYFTSLKGLKPGSISENFETVPEWCPEWRSDSPNLRSSSHREKSATKIFGNQVNKNINVTLSYPSDVSKKNFVANLEQVMELSNGVPTKSTAKLTKSHENEHLLSQSQDTYVINRLSAELSQGDNSENVLFKDLHSQKFLEELLNSDLSESARDKKLQDFLRHVRTTIDDEDPVDVDDVVKTQVEKFSRGSSLARSSDSPGHRSVDIATENGTSVYTKVSGLTDKLEKLGIDIGLVNPISKTSTLPFMENRKHFDPFQNDESHYNVGDHSADSEKIAIVCPDCTRLNRPYVTWCLDCGCVLMGVTPTPLNSRKRNKSKKGENKYRVHSRSPESEDLRSETLLDADSSDAEINLNGRRSVNFDLHQNEHYHHDDVYDNRGWEKLSQKADDDSEINSVMQKFDEIEDRHEQKHHHERSKETEDEDEEAEDVCVSPPSNRASEILSDQASNVNSVHHSQVTSDSIITEMLESTENINWRQQGFEPKENDIEACKLFSEMPPMSDGIQRLTIQKSCELDVVPAEKSKSNWSNKAFELLKKDQKESPRPKPKLSPSLQKQLSLHLSLSSSLGSDKMENKAGNLKNIISSDFEFEVFARESPEVELTHRRMSRQEANVPEINLLQSSSEDDFTAVQKSNDPDQFVTTKNVNVFTSNMFDLNDELQDYDSTDDEDEDDETTPRINDLGNIVPEPPQTPNSIADNSDSSNIGNYKNFLSRIMDDKRLQLNKAKPVTGISKSPKWTGSKRNVVNSKTAISSDPPKRIWEKSNLAWSSFNQGELNTWSSLDVKKGSRPSSGGKRVRPASSDQLRRPQSRNSTKNMSSDKSVEWLGPGISPEMQVEPPKFRAPPILKKLPIRKLPAEKYKEYAAMSPRITHGDASLLLCLPEEILLHILSYLTHQDLKKISLTCSHLYRIANDDSLWKAIYLVKKDLNDSWLCEIASHRPQQIWLVQCSGERVTAHGLRALFRQAADSLTDLNISSCHGGSLTAETILLHAASRCTRVRSLDVSWTNINDTGIEAVSESAKRLESVILNGCHGITDAGVTSLTSWHGKTLKSLELFGCFNITSKGVKMIGKRCVNLTNLNLGQCYKITDSDIKDLAPCLTRLKHLDIRGCKLVKDMSIHKIVRHCMKLETIAVANIPGLTNSAIVEIASYLSNIKSVDISGCKQVNDIGVRTLASSCPLLKYVDISSTGTTHRSVFAISNQCPEIETLKVNFCKDVTEECLISLARNCRRLSNLHIFGLNGVSDVTRIKNANAYLNVHTNTATGQNSRRSYNF